MSNPLTRDPNPDFFVRAIRFLLLLLMLAVMPFQSWAGARTCAVGNTVQADSCSTLAQDAAVATAGDAAHAAAIDASAAPGSADVGDAKDPSQPGADLAESLLPASPPRFAAGLARSAAPAHRAGVMSDPDLPLQQRPPSA